MHALFVSKDKGNALAGATVAREFHIRVHDVTYMLDRQGAAWQQYQTDEVFRSLFGGLRIIHSGEAPAYVEKADVIFVTLSASGTPSEEMEACRIAQVTTKPCYGLEEVLGGRHNPGWEEGEDPPIRTLKRLFTVMRTDEDSAYPVCVVGPPQLERYRGVNIEAVGREARQKLGLTPDTPLIYYSGQPEPENPHVLSRVGEAISRVLMSRPSIRDNPVLVVSRHSRERTKLVPDNAAAHRHALRHIRDRVGICVIENSLDHKDLPADHPEAISGEFRPREFATYQEIVCACKRRGVIVTGFGGDGAVVAPHLGVPSVLYLDRSEYLFGGLLRREKNMLRLPIPVVPQVPTVSELAGWLNVVLYDESGELATSLRQGLEREFPFPEKDPSELIADIVLDDLSTEIGLIE